MKIKPSQNEKERIRDQPRKSLTNKKLVKQSQSQNERIGRNGTSMPSKEWADEEKTNQIKKYSAI